jgi:hypothetical protein
VEIFDKSKSRKRRRKVARKLTMLRHHTINANKAFSNNRSVTQYILGYVSRKFCKIRDHAAIVENTVSPSKCMGAARFPDYCKGCDWLVTNLAK